MWWCCWCSVGLVLVLMLDFFFCSVFVLVCCEWIVGRILCGWWSLRLGWSVLLW